MWAIMQVNQVSGYKLYCVIWAENRNKIIFGNEEVKMDREKKKDAIKMKQRLAKTKRHGPSFNGWKIFLGVYRDFVSCGIV